MIRIKGRGVVYGEYWDDEEPQAGTEGDAVDIEMHRHRSAPLAGVPAVPLLSLVSDLSGEAGAIADKFNRDCRYKVRRADTKDGLTLEFIVQPESRLEEFRVFYEAFAREKSVPPCYPEWLVAASRAGQLVLGSASRNGEVLVWHANVVSRNMARLEYSASCFRERENGYRALVGRANRWLHWKELLQFKEMGIGRYDWGGLFADESTPERAGINQFKHSFGGERSCTYDCTLPVTLKGRVWLKLRELSQRRKSALTSGATAPLPAVA
jgi:hypothetical protein